MSCSEIPNSDGYSCKATRHKPLFPFVFSLSGRIVSVYTKGTAKLSGEVELMLKVTKFYRWEPCPPHTSYTCAARKVFCCFVCYLYLLLCMFVCFSGVPLEVCGFGGLVVWRLYSYKNSYIVELCNHSHSRPENTHRGLSASHQTDLNLLYWSSEGMGLNCGYVL